MIRVFFRRCGRTRSEQHETAYALLSAAAGVIGADPGTVGAVEKTAAGKPFFSLAPELYFSLSHTPGLAVCAIGDRPCGVDAETIRPIPKRVRDRYLGGLDGEDAVRRWTERESYGKLTGEGLAVGAIPASARFTSFRLPDGVLITVCTAEDTPVADIRELPRDGVSCLS